MNISDMPYGFMSITLCEDVDDLIAQLKRFKVDHPDVFDISMSMVYKAPSIDEPKTSMSNLVLVK